MVEPARGTSERSSPHVVLVRLDQVNSTATFLRSDGKEAVFPLPSATRDPTSAIARMSWDLGSASLQFETITGDEIVAELARSTDFVPRRNGPVIYLDQNHWSTLANTIHAPEKVRQGDELEAARHVIDLALGNSIILPMSAGHMAETCKWTDNDARYRLALTILKLSAGWQMRDPLDVRRFELRRSFVARFKPYHLVQPAVFTLEPGVVQGETRDAQGYEPSEDLPEEVAFAVRALTCVSAAFDVMLDAESVEIGESPAWVIKLQRFTDWMAGEPRDSHRRRQRTNLMFMSDLAGELAEEAQKAGITPEEMVEWLQDFSDADISKLPSLGLFREVLHEKLLNPGTRWESNDLTDIMYLTCAAGYADHVVGENSLTAQMEQALRRLGRPVRVHRRLAGLVEAI